MFCFSALVRSLGAKEAQPLRDWISSPSPAIRPLHRLCGGWGGLDADAWGQRNQSAASTMPSPSLPPE